MMHALRLICALRVLGEIVDGQRHCTAPVLTQTGVSQIPRWVEMINIQRTISR